MTGERRAKGRRKSKGGSSEAAAEVANDRYVGVESAGDEVGSASKWRPAGKQQTTAARSPCSWLSCIFVVSVVVAVGAAACVFYGDAIIHTLEEYGVDTDSVLRGIYPKSVREDASDESLPGAQANSANEPPSSSTDDSVHVEQDDSISVDNDGPTGSSSTGELPYDEATPERHEQTYDGDSEELVAAKAAETYDAGRLEEDAAPAASVSDDDDVVLSIGKAQDSRLPEEDRQQRASSSSNDDQASADDEQVPPAAHDASYEQERQEALSPGEPAVHVDAVERADEHRDGEVPRIVDDEDVTVRLGAASSHQRPADGPSRHGGARKPYGKRELTSAADNFIRRELDAGDDLVDQSALPEAKDLFEKIMRRYPASPRAHYGLARALDAQSEKEQSNGVLEAAITWYEKLLQLADVPDALYVRAAERLADRQHFRGWSSKAVSVLRRLVAKFPDRAEYKNRLGVQLLLANKPLEAKLVFRQVLLDKPDDGFAKVHLGFILKTSENDLAASVPLLREGIDSGAEGVIDGRFFFQLGDAYQRLGQRDEAAAIYARGAEQGLFLSAWQRSLYNVDRLTGRPWWTSDQLPLSYQGHLRMMEEHWETIRDEGLAQIDATTGLFVPEDENLRKNGTWKQYTLYSQGRKHPAACSNAPKTCALIDSIPEAATCKRGQVKFSLMLPGTHVWPHCGPTNCRVRAHLGLVVPDGPRIRVQDEIREWSEGKFIIFDDSFEHEVWHTGTEKRLVLIVDLWHPELTDYEKRTMAAI